MAERSVADLLEDCRKGRQPAMQAFYERFYSYALSVCLAYAGNREDAREILNDGFLKLFSRLETLKNEESVLPWLRRIMVNTAIDYYRKSRKRIDDVSIDGVDFDPAEPYLNEEAIFAQLSAEHILSVLHQLAVPYRLVFSLYVLEGYAHGEIAQQLGIAESTSRAHLTEANRRLRQALSAQTTKSHEPTKR